MSRSVCLERLCSSIRQLLIYSTFVLFVIIIMLLRSSNLLLFNVKTQTVVSCLIRDSPVMVYIVHAIYSGVNDRLYDWLVGLTFSTV